MKKEGITVNIIKSVDGATTIVKIEGRFDNITAPQAEEFLNEVVGTCDKLLLDCSDLTYISSSGLRVLVSVNAAIEDNGGVFRLVKVNDIVMETFVITGFTEVLDIEK